MKTGDSYEVQDLERGLVFRGSMRTLQSQSLKEYSKLLIFFQLRFLQSWGWFPHTHLRHDVWCGEGALTLSTGIQASLGQPMIENWNLLPPFSIYYTHKLIREEVGSMLWRPSSNHGFAMKIYYKML